MTQEQLVIDLLAKIKAWKEWSDQAVSIIRALREDDELQTLDIAIATLERDRERMRWGEG